MQFVDRAEFALAPFAAVKPRAGLWPMDSDQYLERRVEDQLKYYEGAADREKRRHVLTQSVVITFGAIVPVVVNLPAWSIGWFDLSVFARIIATILSLTVAILTGLANFRKSEDLWLTYRMTQELLKREKYLYLTHSGDYSDPNTAFGLFVDRFERLISVEHNRFQTLVKEARHPTKPSTPSVDGADTELDT